MSAIFILITFLSYSSAKCPGPAGTQTFKQQTGQKK